MQAPTPPTSDSPTSTSPTPQPTSLSPTSRSPTPQPTSLSPTSRSPTHMPSTLGPGSNPFVVPTRAPGAPRVTFGPSPNPLDLLRTNSPTSKSPTRAPTEPTNQPTLSPTTTSPTQAPTTPTNSPTPLPTMGPTPPTTGTPSLFPTLQPTKAPTNPTTAVPTLLPTLLPTKQPTSAQSIVTRQFWVNSTQGGHYNDSEIVVDAQADTGWGTGGWVTIALTPPDLFAQNNPSPNEVVTDVASMNFMPPGQGIVPVANLLHPVVFQVKLTSTGAKSLIDTARCERGEVVTTPLSPQCTWYNASAALWNTSGCTSAPSGTGFVGCSCNHLTDFSAILPAYNKLPPQALVELSSQSIAAHPLTLITLLCLYTIFIFCVAYGIRFDSKDKNNLATRRDKEAKWMSSLAKGNKFSFWKRYKSAMQRKHTLFSLFFRKKGLSFRSVDRACVTLVAILTCMSMSARYHGQSQNYVGFGLVIFSSAVVSLLPYLALEAIFTRIGPQGYKDAFDLANGIRPVPNSRCCRCWAYYRFPERLRWPMYVGVLIMVVGMSWYILALGVQFDQNLYFICSGNASSAWMVNVLFSILANLLVVQPLKLLVMSAIAHSCQRFRPITSVSRTGVSRKEKGMMELQEFPG